MYLKKRGTVLISTVIILALMSVLGCFIYKMMKNNNEMGNLYTFDKDIYDLDEAEENTLKNFMEELNKANSNKEDGTEEENSEDRIEKHDELNDKELEINNVEDESEIQNVFSEDFVMRLGKNTLEYKKSDNKIFLTTQKSDEVTRKREIEYIIRDKKIILIPTYKFE